MRSVYKTVFDLLNDGSQLGDQGRHAEALQLFSQAQRECQRLGIRSPQVAWCLAVCNDYLGEHERALLFIREHLLLDPLSLVGRRSLGIISERACAALASLDRDVGAVDTPRLYDLLVDVEAADARAHLAMARHWLHAEQVPKALELLEALVVLVPTNESAWHLLSSAAGRCGRNDLVHKAAAALLGLGRSRSNHFLLGAGTKVADA